MDKNGFYGKPSVAVPGMELPSWIMDILLARGLAEPEQIRRFLYPEYADLYSPFALKDMGRAVKRIRTAIEKNETIALFSDSDLDGLTSLTIVYNLLKKLGVEPVLRYPENDEDYGLTTAIVDELNSAGVNLVITLDCGIRDVNEIRYASVMGMEVIVTDHHEPDRCLPDCIILNPLQPVCTYPFKNLAGVGVAFKMCHGLIMSYLPVYDKLFVLLHESHGHIEFAFLRNSVIEYSTEDGSTDELVSLLDSSGPVSLVYECSDTMLEVFNTYAIKKYPFASLMNTQDLTLENSAGIRENTYHPSRISVMIHFFLLAHMNRYSKITDFMREALEFVAVGTVADVMPLVNENRTLVSLGLSALRKTSHPGFSLIMRDMTPTTRLIGWTMGPLLNTPGRLGKTVLTAEFLLNRGSDIQSIHRELLSLNDSRKKLVQEHMEELRLHHEIFDADGEGVIILERNIPDGFAGLLAARVSDMTGRPVIVLAMPGREGLVKGSGRSKGQHGFFAMIEEFQELFERFGGHDRAFGFTIRDHRIETLYERISGKKLPENTARDIKYDVILHPGAVTVDFIRSLSLLEPYGPGNDEPVFLSRCCRIREFRTIGEGAVHGRFLLNENPAVQVIGWNMAERMKSFPANSNVDLYYTLEINSFNGSDHARLILRDITPGS